MDEALIEVHGGHWVGPDNIEPEHIYAEEQFAKFVWLARFAFVASGTVLGVKRLSPTRFLLVD